MNEMAENKMIIIVFGCVGMFMSVRPHRTYLEEYIHTNYPNITDNEIQFTIFPVKNYSCLMLAPILVILIDYVKYKPIIILQAVFSVISLSLLSWYQQIVGLITTEVFHGFIMATTMAYYAYLFSTQEPEKYKFIVSLSEVFVLFGKFLGDVLSILLFVLKATTLETLNIASFVFSLLTFLVACILPSIKLQPPTTKEIVERELRLPNGQQITETPQKPPWEAEHRPSLASTDTQAVVEMYAAYAGSNMYSDIDTSSLGFYGDYTVSGRYTSSIGSESLDENSIGSGGENSGQQDRNPKETLPATTQKEKCNKFVKELVKEYSEKVVIYWSVWLVVSMCADMILNDYFHRLLDELVPARRSPLTYDPIVSCLGTLLGMVPVLIYGRSKGNYSIYSEPILAVLSLCLCLFYALICSISNVWSIYVVFIINQVVYQLAFVMALYELGKVLESRRYGFVFGVGMLGAVLVKVIFQAVLNNRHALNFPVATQIMVIAAMLGVFGLCFVIKMVYSLIEINRQNGGCCSSHGNPQDEDLLVASTS